MNNKNISSVIDGISDEKKITSVFSDKYREILDDDNSQGGRIFDSTADVNFSNNFHVYFISSNIDDSILKLKNGVGFDLIHANHLKFSGPQFRALIGRFFTICMSHSYVPKLMIQGVIKPVLKGNSICKAKSENYRAVMNSSMFLKMLEYCLLLNLSQKLKTTPLLFGFREGSIGIVQIRLLRRNYIMYITCHQVKHH